MLLLPVLLLPLVQGPAQAAAPTLPELVAAYKADRELLARKWSFPFSPAGHAAREKLGGAWLARLDRLDFAALPRRFQVDWLLLRDLVRHDLRAAATAGEREEEVLPVLPFVAPLVELLEARARRELVDPEQAADILDRVHRGVLAARERLQEERPPLRPPLARRAARMLGELRQELEVWHRFGSGYDPLFTWWCEAPWQALDEALQDYGRFLEKELGGLDPDDRDRIVGDPIGREALLAELAFARIPYTPEELIAIGERELAWCQEERLRAARELGFEDDWRAAQEHVKEQHVPPGAQPRLILDLAREAVDFLRERDLLTIPKLAWEGWRMQMMSLERQKFTPYFTGGEVISIAYPTPAMSHADKLMSMRGNNIHFSRATVHHELIPGHHLQGYMARRWNPHRQAFRTPFLVEGWALYWELRLWDLGFPRNAEDRIGMLFWRAHRCARIVFSLKFHLGEWSPEECVDFLVEQVGHERRNAEGEVRRSVQGGYGPLYQCAYMLGGLQLRALHDELVGAAGWSEKRFHDAVLRQGPIPIELLRATLREDLPLDRDFPVAWRFGG